MSKSIPQQIVALLKREKMMKQHEVAHELDIAIITVSGTLARMKTDGILKIEDNAYQLSDEYLRNGFVRVPDMKYKSGFKVVCYD